jgi:hypothetical protein
MKRLGVFAAVIAVAVVTYKMAFPSYSYRYRLQLTLEIEGKPYTGSSVIEVSWSCGPKIADSGCAATLGGQATMIDLGSRGVLVATLYSGGSGTPTGTDAVFLCAIAFGNGSTHQELPTLSRLSGRRDLSPKDFPHLIWFPDRADRKSATRITLENLSSTIDPTAHFTAGSVEITRDWIVIDVADKLPWYPDLRREQKGKGITTWPGQLNLVHNMFVGEDS